MLFNFQIFGIVSQLYFWTLITNLIIHWSDHILCMISVLMETSFMAENLTYTDECILKKNAVVVLMSMILNNVFCGVKFPIVLLIFCILILSLERSVEISNYNCGFIYFYFQFCFMYFEAL